MARRTRRSKRPRRRKGTGSVFPAAGRWVAQVGIIKPDGKRRYVTRWRRNEREAKLALDGLLASVGRGADPAAATQTLDTWLTAWLSGVRPSIAAKSYESYADQVRLHISPLLGGITLDRLRPADVRRLIADRLAAGKSPTTVRGIVGTLGRAMRAAISEGVIVRNPIAGVPLPRMEQRPIEALSPARARALIEAVAGERYGTFYLLLLGSGLRRGEALALDWRDVDLDGGSIRVRAGKTRSAIRTVPVPGFVVATLRTHRSASTIVGLDEPIFRGRDGQRLTGSAVSHEWGGTLRSLGLPPMRLHDLRHGHATLLLASGTPMRLIADQLGHTNPNITARVYTHVLEDQQRAAVDRLDAALARNRQSH